MLLIAFSQSQAPAFQKQEQLQPKLSVEDDTVIEKKIFCPGSQDESSPSQFLEQNIRIVLL